MLWDKRTVGGRQTGRGRYLESEERRGERDTVLKEGKRMRARDR